MNVQRKQFIRNCIWHELFLPSVSTATITVVTIIKRPSMINCIRSVLQLDKRQLRHGRGWGVSQLSQQWRWVALQSLAQFHQSRDARARTHGSAPRRLMGVMFCCCCITFTHLTSEVWVWAALRQGISRVVSERLLQTRSTLGVSVKALVSVGLTKMGQTDLVFIDPGVKISGAYYPEEFLPQMRLHVMQEICGNFLSSSKTIDLLLLTAHETINLLMKQHIPAFISPNLWPQTAQI